MLTVIGAGLPRTGTSSLKAALEQLGYGPCHHMFEVMGNPQDQVERWIHAATSDNPDWEWVLEGYGASVDWPSSYFWRELTRAYPEAKVILTVRDPHRWYASMRDTIFRAATEASANEKRPSHLPRFEEFHQHVVGPMGQATFGLGLGNGAPDEETAVAAFQHHVDEVKAALPTDRLLVYQVSEGWQPLCDFLGATPPADTPFPHLNDSEIMQQFMQGVGSGEPVASPFNTVG